MKTWLQRVSGIAFLSLGLACLFFPFRDFRSITVEVETVKAKMIGFVDPESAAGGGLQKVWTLDETSRERLPEALRKALDSLTVGDVRLDQQSFRASGEQLMACQPPAGIPVKSGGVFLIRDGEWIFEVRNPLASFTKTILDTGNGLQTKSEGLVMVLRRGRVFPQNSDWLVWTNDWRERPKVRDLFEPRRPSLEEESPSEMLTWQEWQEFVRAANGQSESSNSSKVIHRGLLFEVVPASRYLDEERVVPKLGVFRRGLGGILMGIGACLLLFLYRAPGMQGAIQIGSPRQQIPGDVIVTMIAIVAWVPLVDASLHRWFDVDAIADEAFGRFMGGFFLITGIPSVSLYLCMIGAQWFQVDRAGVRLRSLFSDRSIPWGEIRDIDVDKGGLFPVFRAGIPLPRTLQKSLIFQGPQDRIAVMEPPEKVKREILDRVKSVVPDSLNESLRIAGEKWKGYESW